ncbi:MAG: Rpn family recombination-promoting nuclease/putative transposase, partial [Magnetococcus sp. WYHC-3]
MKFIDPRIDFAFKKIFGSEDAKDCLISFLESLLGLEGEHRLEEVALMDPFLAPRLQELKYSILDVRCRDRRGVTFIVEMQVQKAAAFLKRIQYNAAKAYVQQISSGEDYPKLNQVVAITIVDFVLFPGFAHCVSCHETSEVITGTTQLHEIVYYFIELPKFTKSLEEVETTLEQWIHFLRWAGSMDHVPECGVAPIRHAY